MRTTHFLTRVVVTLIEGYQKYISPYKGFSCAHRISTGSGTGCSGYGKKVFQRYGIVTGYRLLQRRFYDCRWHSEQLKRLKGVTPSYRKYQGGVLDACEVLSACDGCDLPDCHAGKKLGCMCDMLDCLPCDLLDTSGKKDKKFQDKRNKRNAKRWKRRNNDADSLDTDD